jgi:hypothetical protein
MVFSQIVPKTQKIPPKNTLYTPTYISTQTKTHMCFFPSKKAPCVSWSYPRGWRGAVLYVQNHFGRVLHTPPPLL